MSAQIRGGEGGQLGDVRTIDIRTVELPRRAAVRAENHAAAIVRPTDRPQLGKRLGQFAEPQSIEGKYSNPSGRVPQNQFGIGRNKGQPQTNRCVETLRRLAIDALNVKMSLLAGVSPGYQKPTAGGEKGACLIAQSMTGDFLLLSRGQRNERQRGLVANIEREHRRLVRRYCQPVPMAQTRGRLRAVIVNEDGILRATGIAALGEDDQV